MNSTKFRDGGDLVAQVLKKNEINCIFTLCGGHISPILIGCKSQGITVIDVRHEANAAFGADTYARLTGKPGICAVTAGPGITNTVTAVRNAKLAEVPLVILGGATATVLRGRGALQDIDQLELMKSNVKYSATISSVREIVPKLQRAMEEAMSGVKGPVFVELPLDILYAEEIVRPLYGIRESTDLKTLQEKFFNNYLKWKLNRIFRPNTTPISKIAANYPIAIPSKQVIEVLHKSERPIMIVGSQALHEIGIVHELAEAISKLNIPTYLSGMARGLLGRNSHIQMRHKRRAALRDADLVILCGTPMDFRLDYGRQINKHAVVIQLNLDQKQLNLNGLLRKVKYKIRTSPSHYVIELQKLVGSVDLPTWMETLRERDNRRNEEIVRLSEEKPEKYLNPLKVVRVLEEYISEDSILIGDGGDFLASASYVISPRKPLTWLDPGVFGTLGPGAGFALASKFVHPESEVWIIYGDGSAGYSLMEIDTMVRHGLPVIIVIGNDASWAQIAREQVEFFGDPLGTVLEYTNYHKISSALGGEGFLVNNEEELVPTIKKAKEVARNGKPVVLNILLGKSDFRKGSISV